MNIVSKFALYTLSLKTLTFGTHTFEYDLDDRFFADMEGNEFSKGNIHALVEVIKTTNSVELNFHLQGIITVACTRCLDEMPLSIDIREPFFVRFGESYSEESEKVITIPESEGVFNIAWLMYEFIALAIPMYHTHEEGTCNQEMMAQFERYVITEKDAMGEEQERTQDPRWDALKHIIDNN